MIEEVATLPKQGVSLWYCPIWGCPFTARETEKIVLHLEKHCKPDEVTHRELERFRRFVLNGRTACGKNPDDPEHPKNKQEIG